MKTADEAVLDKIFKKRFSEIHKDGLMQGAVAICRVILDKATDNSKTPEERIKNITDFCETSLKSKQ